MLGCIGPYLPFGGFPKLRYQLGRPNDKGYNILESILLRAISEGRANNRTPI